MLKDSAMADKGKRPSVWLRASNAVMRPLLGRLGAPMQGAELLHVRGRASGKDHSVPVNPVMVNGRRYLFAPRGETAWVKNIRVAGEASLQHGRRTEHFRIEEMPDEEKVPIIREYLRRWHWQVGSLVGVPKDADDAALLAIATNHPVFRIIPSSNRGS
jgi:hypothetical protein